MKYKADVKDSVLTIRITGRVNSDNAGEMEEHLASIRKKHAFQSMVLDFAGVEFISSAGLRVLMKLYREDGKLTVINVSDSVYNVFDITGMDDIMDIRRAEPGKGAVSDDPLNDTTWPLTFTPVTALFEEQVAAHPDRLAVVSTGVSMTYAELNEAANRIANTLRYYNVRPDDTVMVLLPRNIMAYAVNLGILKAGAAFAPVSTEYPDERLSYIFRDAGCRFVITTHRIAFDRMDLIIDMGKRPLFLENIVASPWPENPAARIDERDLAYCIYTSGSTGKPKGVMIEQGNLYNFLAHNPKNSETMGLVDRSTVLLARAAMTFDVSIMEEFIPLTSGMTVALASNEEILNPLLMRDFILKHGVDGMCCTPSYLNTLLSLPQLREAMARIQVYDMGAEAFPGSLYEKIRAVNPNAYIMNGYGPTEATISCTMKVIDGSDNVTIGVPNANVYCYIVDEANNEVPRGEIGELLICGKGVGRGYKNLPEKTEASFITFKGMRGYKTGDLARITENNEIEYHGRQDSQVKYHGLRIELGEIEEIMSHSPRINACAAVVYEDRFLCLYYVPEGEASREEVREYAKAHLAHYMIPDLFEPIPRMPMTANMKVDKKALPMPTLPKTEHVAPATPMQERILKIVQDIVPDMDVGVETDLRDVGLSSLSFMVILAQLSDEYRVGLNLAELRDHPSVIGLEQLISSKPRLGGEKQLKDRYPATIMQIGMYVQMLKNNTVDNLLPVVMEMGSTVDTEKLTKAVRQAVAAHPGMFARFGLEETGMGYIQPGEVSDQVYDIPVIECSEEDMKQTLKQLAAELVAPLDYPLFRVRIYRTEKKVYLYMGIAHPIADGASVDILTEDIAAAYDGEPVRPEIMSVFAYNDEMQQLAESPLYAHILGYYKKLFDGLDHWTRLPVDETGLAPSTGLVSRRFALKEKEITEYMDRAKISGNELFIGLLALALAIQTGDRDIPLLFIHNGRNDSRLGRTVGCVIGPGFVRLKIQSGETFADYLRQVQSQIFETMSCQVMPLIELMGMYPDLASCQFIFQQETADQVIEGKPAKTRWLSDAIERSNTAEQADKAPDESTEQAMYDLQAQVFWAEPVMLQLGYQAGRHTRERIEKLAEDMDKMLSLAASKDASVLTLGELLEVDA